MTQLELPRERHRQPPLSSGHFEFVHDHLSEMCAADDIFLQGQLVPHKYKPPPTPPSISTTPRTVNPESHKPLRKFPSVQRNPGLGGPRPSSCPATIGRRRREGLSPEHKRVRSVETWAGAPAMPKWYLVAFGTVTVPAEMEMRDIKSRQKGRCPSNGGPDSDRRRTAPASRSRGGSSWKLLKSLGCKGDLKEVVTADVVTAQLKAAASSSPPFLQAS